MGKRKELALMESPYGSSKFEFLCLYGRRRVGKSTLLYEFAAKHRIAASSLLGKRKTIRSTKLIATKKASITMD